MDKKWTIFFICLTIGVSSMEMIMLNRESDMIMKKLIAYNSDDIQNQQQQRSLLDLSPDTFYYSPYMYQDNAENKSISIVIPPNRQKRTADATFRGKPKTVQEVWSRNFNFTSQEYSQMTSLVTLLKKLIDRYMSACIPVVLYDVYVENSEGFILQRLFEDFPTTLIHGRIDSNYTTNNQYILKPPDSKCRSYILFLSDALMTRQVIGPQLDNKVIIVPRSSQWKLQEFLSSPLSRDIINLLVIGESYSADKSKERPYVLYTHRLYSDGLGSNKPHVLTSWMKGKLSRPHIDLFPKKLTKG